MVESFDLDIDCERLSLDKLYKRITVVWTVETYSDVKASISVKWSLVRIAKAIIESTYIVHLGDYLL